jgi:hypothetical protein
MLKGYIDTINSSEINHKIKQRGFLKLKTVTFIKNISKYGFIPANFVSRNATSFIVLVFIS